MLIGNTYKIESDDLNVTVYKKEIAKKSGVVRWRPLGYFSVSGHPKPAREGHFKTGHLR